jgi:hypothetical protein
MLQVVKKERKKPDLSLETRKRIMLLDRTFQEAHPHNNIE